MIFFIGMLKEGFDNSSETEEEYLLSKFKSEIESVRISFFILMLFPLAICFIPMYEWIKWVFLCFYFLLCPPLFVYDSFNCECISNFRFQTKFPASASIFIIIPYFFALGSEDLFTPFWIVRLFAVALIVSFGSLSFYQTLLMKKDKEISYKSIITYTTRITRKAKSSKDSSQIFFTDNNLLENFYIVSDKQFEECEVNDVIEVKSKRFLMNRYGRDILDVKIIGKDDSFVTDVQQGVQELPVNVTTEVTSSLKVVVFGMISLIGLFSLGCFSVQMQGAVLSTYSSSYLLLLFPIVIVAGLFLYSDYENVCKVCGVEHEIVKIWKDYLIPLGSLYLLTSAMVCFNIVMIYDYNCDAPKIEYALPFKAETDYYYSNRSRYEDLFAKFEHKGQSYKVVVRDAPSIRYSLEEVYKFSKIKVKFKKGFGGVEILDSYDFEK